MPTDVVVPREGLNKASIVLQIIDQERPAEILHELRLRGAALRQWGGTQLAPIGDETAVGSLHL
jgi:hypothetical protein